MLQYCGPTWIPRRKALDCTISSAAIETLLDSFTINVRKTCFALPCLGQVQECPVKDFEQLGKLLTRIL